MGRGVAIVSYSSCFAGEEFGTWKLSSFFFSFLEAPRNAGRMKKYVQFLNYKKKLVALSPRSLLERTAAATIKV